MSTKIIDDLTHIPNIIAGLGLSIAEAQRHFDLDYLQSIERLIVLAQSLLGGRKVQEGQTSVELSAEEKLKLDQFQSVIKDFLIALAPTRYQFTETTLTVKLDLAQHLDVSAGLGASAGISGVAINAAVSIGYGTDYRGAAECRTVLHAVPADQTTLRTLLDRARERVGRANSAGFSTRFSRSSNERALTIDRCISSSKVPGTIVPVSSTLA